MTTPQKVKKTSLGNDGRQENPTEIKKTETRAEIILTFQDTFRPTDFH